ncbi:MAG TPA: hypothetical protein DDW27_12685 [Bacteroidales bacterium]|nr:hypothetical protein [Bacteroidales bacterium]
MRWMRYILILSMIYLVCTARTCNENEEAVAIREERFTMNLKDSIKDVFMSDTIDDKLLRAYEVSAVQKLNDFADYLRIISDTTLDMKFRQHAAELVKGLFVTDEIELNIRSNICYESGLNSMELLLAHSLSEGISCLINPLQITVSKPFVSENDSAFTGNLSFINRYVPPVSRDTSGTESLRLIIDIYLVKRLRSFGEDQLEVWDVYLGDIN